MARTNNLPTKKDDPFTSNLNITQYEAEDEASNLLKNGILVETNKGLICMSLNDALSSNLNLSVEDLQEVATQLILQENLYKDSCVNLLTSVQVNSDLCSTDTTVDSDDPISESNDNIAKKVTHSIKSLSSSNISNVQSNVCLSLPGTSSDSETNIADDANKFMVNCIVKNKNSISYKTLPKCDQKQVPSSTDADTEVVKAPTKRKGGWPKGRKRKPELLHLPPKAPATGYNLYLNDMRKTFKDSSLAFYEITKILGNRWSSLSLEEKKPYLERAEEEKKRYREELRVYRQSGAYQLYLAKKRKKKAQNNVLSESDMDATDDIDDEDNEELYCRTCDQWFHNLHNKREHLQGRQHLQAVAGDMSRELGSDYNTNSEHEASGSSSFVDISSLDGAYNSDSSSPETVTESIINLVSLVEKREREIKLLKEKVLEEKKKNLLLNRRLYSLKEQEAKLKNILLLQKEEQKDLEARALYLLGITYLFND